MEAAELQDACAKRGITHGVIATATKSPWLHVWRVLNGEQVDERILRTAQGMLEDLGFVAENEKTEELYCYIDKTKLATFLRTDRMNHPFIADYLGLQVKSWIYIWSGWRPVDLETQKRLLELFPGVEAQEVFVWEHKLRDEPRKGDKFTDWRQYIPRRRKR